MKEVITDGNNILCIYFTLGSTLSRAVEHNLKIDYSRS